MFYKQIDRRVGGGFLAAFIGAMVLIASLYTVFDLLKRLEDLREIRAGLGMGALASYYACLVPSFLVEIAPGLCLLAAGSVLVRMARNRELLALKASGTSVQRTTGPVFMWTLLISVAIFGVRETVGPDLSRRSQVMDRMLEGKVEHQLLVDDPQYGRKVFVGEYNFAKRTMKAVTILEFAADGALIRSMSAPAGTWSSTGQLHLEPSVVIQRFDVPASQPEAADPAGVDLPTELTPFDLFETASDNAQSGSLFHSLSELREGMREYPNVPYYRVSYHTRLAALFTPLLLLLVGIPCLVGFEQSINSLFLGVIVCLVVATAFYAFTFVLSSMGNSNTIDPVLAGWLPVIITGAVGLWLFESMQT